MALLLIYISIALGVSFLCSIAEAVLLSVSTAYIKLQESQGKKSAALLIKFKDDVDSPLAAILTLNTIAHTMGAAGAGAQAAVVFGSTSVGIFSGVLTLLILVFSEIIPKTLGARYWRELAPATAYGLHWLVKLLKPFIWLSKKMTGGISEGAGITGFSREEFAAMADLGQEEGQLDDRESHILKNLFMLRDMRVSDVMTPRPVLFALPDDLSVNEYFNEHLQEPFSRILIYTEEHDNVSGFVLKSDLLMAQANGDSNAPLRQFQRKLPALVGAISLLNCFEELMSKRAHLMLVVNEYGTTEGIITMEDIFETLLGLEIMDEKDKTKDLRAVAKRFGRYRARAMGMKSE